MSVKKQEIFFYGEFSVDSNKTYKGWFKTKELEQILFLAPKVKK